MTTLAIWTGFILHLWWHKVTIDTLSWQEGAEPVYWESEGGLSYSMSKGSKDTRGTRITLHLSEDSYEFCNEYRVREVLDKYCAFMPVEIYFTNPNAEPIYEEVEIEEDEDSKFHQRIMTMLLKQK